MNENIEIKRIYELVELLNKYNYEYYVLDAPTVSDDVWDTLYRELLDLEKKFGIVLPDSPTQNIGAGGSSLKGGFKKHKHLFALQSLDKSQDIDEVKKWFTGITGKFKDAEFTALYKFDGLRLVLTYDNGRLVTASTRGDGIVGEDVTAQVKTIQNIPMSIDLDGKVEIGGEGLLRKSKLDDSYKNTRNAAAGAIRNIDPNVTAKLELDFFAYDINFTDGRLLLYSKAIILLGELGFPLMLPKRWKGLKTFSDVQGVLEEITNERETLDFDIDGVVISVDDPVIREELGCTVKFPRWAQAFKFQAEIVTTILSDVIWQVGRSGKVTPVAILEPVQLCGATVTRATLNNYGDILRKGVSVGEKVVIRRSNDVIPEVLGAVDSSRCKSNIVDILHCPSCGVLLATVGANKFCQNRKCPARVLEKFIHFVSRDCMNIEGLSEKTLEALIQNGFVSRLGDIYRMSENDLVSLDGFKDKKIKNLLGSIEKSRSVDFARFINALGIPNIGKKASGTLAVNVLDVDGLFNISEAQLVNLDDFGGVMASSVVDYFADILNRDEVYDLCSHVSIQYKKSGQGVLGGIKVCITGTLEKYTRGQLSRVLEGLGAVVVDTVSRNTDVLVVGENAGSKLEKALKLGIKIINENQLSDFIHDDKM